MEIFFWVVCAILFLIPYKKTEKNEEPPLSSPEYMAKYRFYGDKIYDQVDREMDYSKILKKPYRSSRPTREKKVVEKKEEKDSFGDLWIM